MRLAFALGISLAFLLEAPAVAGLTRASNDRTAIGVLIDTYASAVSRKDQASFETLLLSKEIPFAYVPASPVSADPVSWRDYDGFRRSVFQGPPFKQSFRNVKIRLHGALADVDLIYVNVDRQGSHPGWKTMQLIKVGGQWRIASEFFTNLPARSR